MPESTFRLLVNDASSGMATYDFAPDKTIDLTSKPFKEPMTYELGATRDKGDDADDVHPDLKVSSVPTILDAILEPERMHPDLKVSDQNILDAILTDEEKTIWSDIVSKRNEEDGSAEPSSLKVRLWLYRHVPAKNRGWQYKVDDRYAYDPEVTDEGDEMATSLGKMISTMHDSGTIPVRLITSSSLKRARQTALTSWDAYFKAGTTSLCTDLLREVHTDQRDKRVDGVAIDGPMRYMGDPKWVATDPLSSYSERETTEHGCDRVLPVLEFFGKAAQVLRDVDVASGTANTDGLERTNIVVVSHGQFLGECLWNAYQPDDAYWDWDNGEIRTLDLDYEVRGHVDPSKNPKEETDGPDGWSATVTYFGEGPKIYPIRSE